MATIDKDVFANHLKAFYKCWTSQKETWNGADSVAVTVGKYEQGYYKSTSLHVYLFGFEFPSTTLLFTKSELTVLTSSKKVSKYFEPLRQAFQGSNASKLPVAFKVVGMGKDVVEREKQFQTAANSIKTSGEGKRVAVLTKELKYLTIGTHATEWMDSLSKLDGVEQVNASGGFALMFCQKDSTELSCIKKAAFITGRLMKFALVPEMETVVDEGKKVTHEALAEKTEALLQNPEKIRAKYDVDDVEATVQPIIQSGGRYSVKASAQSSEETMKYDIILATLGVRYNNYCASQTRTYFIDPTKEQKSVYSIILETYQSCLGALQPGKPLSAVRDAALNTLKNSSRPDLANYLSKTCMFQLYCSNVFVYQNKMQIIVTYLTIFHFLKYSFTLYVDILWVLKCENQYH